MTAKACFRWPDRQHQYRKSVSCFGEQLTLLSVIFGYFHSISAVHDLRVHCFAWYLLKGAAQCQYRVQYTTQLVSYSAENREVLGRTNGTTLNPIPEFLYKGWGYFSPQQSVVH